jgi:hypothetical protein
MSAEKPTGLAALRVPFSDNQIGKLPKPVKSKDEDKGKCERGSRYSADGYFCGGWHARSIHLDYVGHAALTDRFLDVDPQWSWEPLSVGPNGLPVFDQNGGMWIRLTILGVTRLGYGDAQGKSGGNAVKEAIGDALRNAGMRFGAALDLWHKGDLRSDVEAESEPAPRQSRTQAPEADASNDPAVVRARIAAVAKTKEVSIQVVGDNFATWSQGTKITEADGPTLLKYLDHINEHGIAA